MIGLMPGIALKHLLARRRQSLVSLSGIVLGSRSFWQYRRGTVNLSHRVG